MPLRIIRKNQRDTSETYSKNKQTQHLLICFFLDAFLLISKAIFNLNKHYGSSALCTWVGLHCW